MSPARVGTMRFEVGEIVNGRYEILESLGQGGMNDAFKRHDWEELIAIAADALDHGRECRLLPKLRQVSEMKYNQALTATNQMRRSFLTSKTSMIQPSDAKRAAPIAVLGATSAITA
jgi:hypothetical protein